MEDLLEDADGLARMLKISKATVRAWSRDPAMPKVKIGRLVRFRVREVLSWIEKGGGSLAKGRSAS